MTFLPATTPVVYILHENNEWMPPLLAGFDAENVPAHEWLLDAGSIDLTQAPPEGVFWSRLSASSHARGHAYAKESARSVLRWLEAHGRRVISGTHVVELEVSKVAQYAELTAAGFDVPATLAVCGVDDLRSRARIRPALHDQTQSGWKRTRCASIRQLCRVRRVRGRS